MADWCDRCNVQVDVEGKPWPLDEKGIPIVHEKPQAVTS